MLYKQPYVQHFTTECNIINGNMLCLTNDIGGFFAS